VEGVSPEVASVGPSRWSVMAKYSNPLVTCPDFLKGAANGILNNIKAKLRERILEEIKPDLDEAVEAAINDTRIILNAMYRIERMDTLIEVVLTDRRANDV
jgi:hypothetical protein